MFCCCVLPPSNVCCQLHYLISIFTLLLNGCIIFLLNICQMGAQREAQSYIWFSHVILLPYLYLNHTSSYITSQICNMDFWPEGRSKMYKLWRSTFGSEICLLSQSGHIYLKKCSAEHYFNSNTPRQSIFPRQNRLEQFSPILCAQRCQP